MAASTITQRPVIESESARLWIAQSTLAPTEQLYQEFQTAYSIYNREFFHGELPDCVITLQRTGGYGYYCPGRFISRDGKRSDEIALNPVHFAARSDIGVLSTLTHEMAHLWRRHFAKPGRVGYHDKIWANQMTSIGLQPSHSGKPGGRQTGYQMTHYIIEGGPFEIVTTKLFGEGFRLSWAQSKVTGAASLVTAPPSPDETDGSHRWKYTCPKCGFNAWAKPNGLVDCGTCHILMPQNVARKVRR